MERRYIPFDVAAIPYLFPVTRISLPLFFSLLSALPAALSAQTVTFHADVAPIIYTHCTECHRVGEIGPMPLTNYAEDVDIHNAVTIADLLQLLSAFGEPC